MSAPQPDQSHQQASNLDDALSLAADIARSSNQLCRILLQSGDGSHSSSPPPVLKPSPRPSHSTCRRDAEIIRDYIRARRHREAKFPRRLFADPAWDLLLDLYVALTEGRNVSISSACLATAVPATTALRWISHLEKEGLVERQQDPEDGRRTWIHITPSALSGINSWLDLMWPQSI